MARSATPYFARPIVVLELALLASGAWALWSTIRFSGDKLERSYLYYVPIVAPFVALLLERSVREEAKLRRLVWLDLVVILVAMWRVIGEVPLVSGHALFLTYAVATARTWVVFFLSALVLAETLYLKLFVWHDITTVIVGVGLGTVGASVYWWLAPSLSHVLASHTGTSNYALHRSARR